METQEVTHKLSPCYLSLLLPSLSFSALNIIKLREPVGLSLKHDELLKITVLHNSCVCNHNCCKSKSRKVWHYFPPAASYCFFSSHLHRYSLPCEKWYTKVPFFSELSSVFILTFLDSYESVQIPLPTKTKKDFQLNMKAALVYWHQHKF